MAWPSPLRLCIVATNPTLAPIRICAGAFGNGAPARDLFVSGDHAIHVGAALIPARYLCNGSTIRRQPPVAVEYFHIELNRHQVLLAEGLPAKSWLDTGNRAALESAPLQPAASLTTASTASV